MESCSFHLTPEIKQRLVALSYRNKDGQLRPWAGEVEVIEQDPQKGAISLVLLVSISSSKKKQFSFI